jgi:hypothetical protein
MTKPLPQCWHVDAVYHIFGHYKAKNRRTTYCFIHADTRAEAKAAGLVRFNESPPEKLKTLVRIVPKRNTFGCFCFLEEDEAARND